MAGSITAPFDVRLMNLLSALLFALFGLMLLVSGAWWVLRQPIFPLTAIKVDGDLAHSNAATLRANVVPQLAGNFFTINLTSARAAFESMPWVRKAVVRREFPNKLRATLVEHVPVAHWGGENGAQLIDSYGEVFQGKVGERDRLPRLDGPMDQAVQVLAMYRMLDPLFVPYGLSVERLTLSSRGSWKAVLQSGSEIEFGRGTTAELAERTQRFLSSARRVARQYGRAFESIESADLRHKDAYALRLRGVTTVLEHTGK